MTTTLYRHRATALYPVTDAALRYRERARASFGDVIGADVADALGYDTVQVAAIPDHDPATHVAQPDAPQIIAGEWSQGWTLRALTPEEIAAPLTTARAQVWEQIKAERERRKASGTQVAGKWYHSDADSRIQQLGLVMMGAAVPAVPWKTLDGSFVEMSQALAMQIFQATAASDMALFAHAESLRAAVDAATNPHSVDIGAGWPVTFAG